MYFGYKDDYKRNRKGFLFTLISVIIMLAGFVVIASFDSTLAFVFLGLYAFFVKKIKTKTIDKPLGKTK